ncbi:MAG TPA: 16S rRNA (guanine(966)-N(2))-methyltransferase RsmD [Zeimonas sp.]|nr:16S rRNA (guanine(966)-N(2))-methyltransferase RsmD [Zeimonas sp.]
MKRRGRAAAAAVAGACAPSASRGRAGHRIRIIGGRWRRTPIHVADVEGLRPTPDRVRETLFNWLGQRIDGWRCLDLFAGTGALGFEAASRGAARVVLVERDRRARAAIGQTLERLGSPPQLELVAADAFDALRRLASAGERFDLVFVDPPFGESLHLRVLDALPAVLAPGALVYLESGERFEMPAQWRVLREGRAGQVRYHLLSRAADALPGHDA